MIKFYIFTLINIIIAKFYIFALINIIIAKIYILALTNIIIAKINIFTKIYIIINRKFNSLTFILNCLKIIRIHTLTNIIITLTYIIIT